MAKTGRKMAGNLGIELAEGRKCTMHVVCQLMRVHGTYGHVMYGSAEMGQGRGWLVVCSHLLYTTVLYSHTLRLVTYLTYHVYSANITQNGILALDLH